MQENAPQDTDVGPSPGAHGGAMLRPTDIILIKLEINTIDIRPADVINFSEAFKIALCSLGRLLHPGSERKEGINFLKIKFEILKKFYAILNPDLNVSYM